MIYVVSAQQDLHLAQFFKVLSLLEYPWANKLRHVNYGLVQGMSTRRGTAVFLDDIIREASETMHEQMKKNEEKYAAIEDPEGTSREVGITAVKIQDMQAKRYVGQLSVIATGMAYTEVRSAESTTTPSTGPECCHSRATLGHTSNTHTSDYHLWLERIPNSSPSLPQHLSTPTNSRSPKFGKSSCCWHRTPTLSELLWINWSQVES